MRGRRGAGDEDPQITFAWSDPARVLDAVDLGAGDVLFEAPEVSRIVAGTAPRVPRVRVRRHVDPPSFGLPFGLRHDDGRFFCWSCSRELADDEIVRAGPGYSTCPGCGARLPFAE